MDAINRVIEASFNFNSSRSISCNFSVVLNSRFSNSDYVTENYFSVKAG